MTSQPVPPKIKSAPPVGLLIATISGAVFFGAAAVVIYFFNPSRYGFYPVCLFHEATGLNCPGCGGTRSFYALLHGNLPLAIKENALFIGALAFFGVRGLWYVQRKLFRRPAKPFFPANWLWPLLVVMVVFFVLRNLPAFSFLSP